MSKELMHATLCALSRHCYRSSNVVEINLTYFREWFRVKHMLATSSHLIAICNESFERDFSVASVANLVSVNVVVLNVLVLSILLVLIIGPEVRLS